VPSGADPIHRRDPDQLGHRDPGALTFGEEHGHVEVRCELMYEGGGQSTQGVATLGVPGQCHETGTDREVPVFAGDPTTPGQLGQHCVRGGSREACPPHDLGQGDGGAGVVGQQLDHPHHALRGRRGLTFRLCVTYRECHIFKP
jgi:hypothetical protein